MRAEWAFKIFDSDGDQLLGENDIRFSPRSTTSSTWCLQHSGAWSMQSPGQTRLLTKALTTRLATRWSGTSSSEQKQILSIANRNPVRLSWEKNQNRFILTLAGKPTSTELDRFPLPSSSKWWSGGQNPSNKLLQCTMWKLKNEPKSVQLWKHFSPWMLMQKVPNFKQRYLNSQKMEICKNIWKYWGKVGGKFQKTWRGWLIKSRLVSKNPSRRADFFL